MTGQFEQFQYTASETSVTITKYLGEAPCVTVPSTINGLPVTELGDEAFEDSDTLEEVILPEGLAVIGASTFHGCEALRQVNLPGSVRELKGDLLWGAFSDCVSLTQMTIPQGVTTLGDALFSGCTSLTQVTLPESITSIGESVFKECSALADITLPHSLTSIGYEAFGDCTSLTQVVLPEGLTTLEQSAFYQCLKLRQVTLPQSLATLGSGAFQLCKSLEEVTLPEGLTTIGYDTFRNCWSLCHVTLPETLTTIEANAFSDCYELDNVTLPQGLTALGSGAFLNCVRLTKVNLPEGITQLKVKKWDNGVFEMCTSLHTVTAANPNVKIAKETFKDASALVKLEQIHEVVFAQLPLEQQCNVLLKGLSRWDKMTPEAKALHIACVKKMKKLKMKLFEGLSAGQMNLFWEGGVSLSLAEVDLLVDYATKNKRTATVEVLENYKAQLPTKPAKKATKKPVAEAEPEGGVPSLKTLKTKWRCGNVAGGIRISGYKGTDTCETIPGVTSDGKVIVSIVPAKDKSYAVLEELTIEGTPQIAEEAFRNCARLRRVTLSEGLTTIEKQTFRGCVQLTEVNIPQSVTAIGEDAFHGCSSLAQVNIPEGITTIEKNAFCGCKSLTQLTLPERLTTIGFGGFANCTGLTQVTLPAGVTTIEQAAFFCCTGLTQVTLPEGLTTLGGREFRGCTSLTHLTLPESLTTLGREVFHGCTALAELTLPEGLTTIGIQCFQDCKSLREVTLPKSLTTIGWEAFANCTKLKTVIAPNGQIELQTDAFAKAPVIAKLDNICEPILRGLPLEQQQSLFVNALGRWGKVKPDTQKWTLTYLKRKKTLQAMLFQGEDVATMSILLDGMLSLGLDEVDGYLDVSIREKRTAVTALLMDYKNKTFDTATVEAAQERETMVDIGFELPTLKELKAKWKCGNVPGGIRITGYKGSGTNEQIPDTTAEGTPIVAIGFAAGATFNPITTLHVGGNVTTIEKKAFTDCHALTQLSFAGEITQMGDSAFRGCTGLADADGFVVVAGVLCHYAGKGGDITLPQGIHSVGAFAFENCQTVTGVTIPEGVTKIERSAFRGCTYLQAVNLPEGVETIGNFAFFQCVSLESLTLKTGLTLIERSGFSRCSNLAQVTLPDTLQEIQQAGFYSCYKLSRLTMPSNVKLGVDAFEGCGVAP